MFPVLERNAARNVSAVGDVSQGPFGSSEPRSIVLPRQGPVVGRHSSMAEAITCRLGPWGSLLMPDDFRCLPDWPSWGPEACKYNFCCKPQNILIWRGSTKIIQPCTGHQNNPILCLREDCCQPRDHPGDIPKCHRPPQCHGTLPSSGGCHHKGWKLHRVQATTLLEQRKEPFGGQPERFGPWCC